MSFAATLTILNRVTRHRQTACYGFVIALREMPEFLLAPISGGLIRSRVPQRSTQFILR
jgi:hypothetical protein